MRALLAWLLTTLAVSGQTTLVNIAWDSVSDATVTGYFVYAGAGTVTPSTNVNYQVRTLVTAAAGATQTASVTVANGPQTFWVTSYNGLESDPSTALTGTIPIATQAPTCNLTASSAAIIRGSTVTLTWTVANAASLGALLEPGVGSVNASGGSVVLTPSNSATYTLTVWNTIGTNTCSVLVDVNAPPPTFTFTRSPTGILIGESSTLTWSAMTDATSATIQPTVGAISVSGGSIMVSPVVTTTYTNTATGPGGTLTRYAIVTVNPALAADFSITPTTLLQGDSATLNWTTYGTCSGVTIDQGVGAKPCGTGSETVSPTVNTTYTMITAGTGGPVTNTATVLVVIPPPPPPPPVPTPGPTVATTAMRKAILIR